MSGLFLNLDAGPYGFPIVLQKRPSDVLLNPYGTVFGSAAYAPEYAASKAFDGNSATSFATLDVSNGYIGMDLGAVRTITQIRVMGRAGFENRSSGGQVRSGNSADLSGFTVRASNPASWPTNPSFHTFGFPGGFSARYVWLYGGIEAGNPAEIEIYGTP